MKKVIALIIFTLTFYLNYGHAEVLTANDYYKDFTFETKHLNGFLKIPHQ